MSQKRYAYLIGANGPKGMQLKHAEKDAIRLADALKGPYCQFTSTEVIIAQSRKDGLAGFKSFTEQCQPSDLLLVHFSGHALFDEQLYLLCNDTDVNDLYSTALEINTLKTILRRSKARSKVLLLDCCHAAGAHPGALKGEQEIREIIQSTVQGSAAVILSACSRQAKARELDALDGGSGFLSWAIRAGCTTNFHEASSSPDLKVLSLDDLSRRWIPKALEQVNNTLCAGNPLPSPILLSELEIAYDSQIWLTNPPSSVQTSTLSIDEARRKYLENVYKRYNSVTLPIGPAEGFTLHAIFQPLALRRDPLAAEDLERKQRRHLLGEQHEEEGEHFHPSSTGKDPSDGKKSPPVRAENGEEALTKSPQGRVVVLGGPGTGKTTTLKHLISSRAQDALADTTAPIPIFLSLADLARSGKTLQSYLIDIVEDMGGERSYADTLWQEMKHGHAFVALDSLDEVDPTQRVRMIELVNSRASEPGNIWLVGSRFTEYKGGQFKHGQFAEWELLPMSSQLRQDLATRLFPELGRLLSPVLPKSSSPSTFVSLLEKHPHAAAWGENPLLLSLAAVVFVKTGGLPPARATLYRDVIEAVLAMRVQDTIARKHLLRTLTSLALWLYQTRGHTFTSDDLLTFLEDIQHRPWEETRNIAKHIITSGILDVVARDTYGFRHRTFQEYLAAAELAKQLTSQDPTTREEAWQFAWSKRTYSRWTEILRLMVGVLAQLPERRARSEAMRWLHQLMEQRLTAEGDPSDLGLALALKSLVEVTEITGWDTLRTAQLEKQIVSVWLHELLDAARSQRETRSEKFQSLAEDVAHLRGYGIDAVVGKLVKALRDRDEDVQSIAGQTLETLAICVPIERVLSLLENKDGIVRTAALRLSQGERVPIERVLALLEDNDRDVRTAAVWVLQGQGERVPIERVLALLEDKDWSVRNAALEVLQKQGERVPIKPLLLLLYDKDKSVRLAAIEVLETQSERIPLGPLIEMLGDEGKDVRDVVLRILKKVAPDVLSDLFPQAMTVLQGKVVGEALTSLTQMYVAETIGKLGMTSTKLLEKLTDLLDSPSWQVRMKAIQALGQLRRNIPDAAIRRLLELRRDLDPKMRAVREAADDVLAEILSLETGIEDE